MNEIKRYVKMLKKDPNSIPTLEELENRYHETLNICNNHIEHGNIDNAIAMLSVASDLISMRRAREIYELNETSKQFFKGVIKRIRVKKDKAV